MISFVCWKWKNDGARPAFESHHVNVLAASVARHYRRPHRFICITDNPVGLAFNVESLPMPRTGFEELVNPSAQAHVRKVLRLRPHADPATVSKAFPSCYRRLWNFSREAVPLLGDRIFALDVDVIVTGDLVPLVDGHEDVEFIGWCDPRFKWNKVAGAAYLLRTGSRTHVWDDFDPQMSPGIAHAAGNDGSDQGWLSHKLWPPEHHWSSINGLLKLSWLQPDVRAPANSRLIFTSGDAPPWSQELQRKHPWITQHWHT